MSITDGEKTPNLNDSANAAAMTPVTGLSTSGISFLTPMTQRSQGANPTHGTGAYFTTNTLDPQLIVMAPDGKSIQFKDPESRKNYLQMELQIDEEEHADRTRSNDERMEILKLQSADQNANNDKQVAQLAAQLTGLFEAHNERKEVLFAEMKALSAKKERYYDKKRHINMQLNGGVIIHDPTSDPPQPPPDADVPNDEQNTTAKRQSTADGQVAT